MQRTLWLPYPVRRVPAPLLQTLLSRPVAAAALVGAVWACLSAAIGIRDRSLAMLPAGLLGAVIWFGIAWLKRLERANKGR